ncbi:hypothetical protein IE53DRAFT_186772 [Violaceomyces palustris]|uniref:Uncharacterized protein n=1 Tax=Violaceomyces palustris TaxID=1673888 RepID=A0ACD0NS13_9BASI|nr:hypothetical protein IE53DRAFT_186772 [Violaceomyces palustris]
MLSWLRMMRRESQSPLTSFPGTPCAPTSPPLPPNLESSSPNPLRPIDRSPWNPTKRTPPKEAKEKGKKEKAKTNKEDTIPLQRTGGETIKEKKVPFGRNKHGVR